MGSPTGILSKDQQILSNNGIAWDSEDEVVLYRRLTSKNGEYVSKAVDNLTFGEGIDR